MFTFKLMGHAHLLRDGRPVPISRKATALLAYLTLEGVPHHREHLADLLWDGSGGLVNLRVELTRLRQQGLDVFPARQSMLALQLPTDFGQWLSAAAQLRAEEVPAWLGAVRAVPLGGLDDLGSSELSAWLDRQRAQLSARIEEQFGQAHARLSRLGRLEVAETIARAGHDLGFHLAPATATRAPVPHLPPPDWPEQSGRVRRVMELSGDSPQLLIVHGQRGSARSLINSALVGSAWHPIQLQYSPHSSHLRHALMQHLLELLPGGERLATGAPLDAGSGDERLMALASVIQRLNRPLLLGLHDMFEAPDWLSVTLGLLMNLRPPLMLVISPTSGSVLGGDAALNLDWSRVHQLTLPSLSGPQVYQRLRAAHPQHDARSQMERAVRVAQVSEGWPPYVEALLSQPELSMHVPEELNVRIRAQLGHLEPATRRALSRLAQMQDQFTLSLAQALLGEPALTHLAAAQNLGLIVHAAPQEDVAFPSLSCMTDDAHSRFVFGSEVTRSSLARDLPPTERQAVRARLAELLIPCNPVMALHYARRVGHPELVARARAALPVAAPISWQRVHAPPVTAPPLTPQPAEPAPSVPGRPPRRALETPNGYRLHWLGGELHLLRRGRPSAPPRLNLCFGAVPPGAWSMVLRLDVFQSPPNVELVVPPYAIGVQVGEGPRQVFAPHVTAEAAAPPDGPTEYYRGMPLGQDVQLSGRWTGAPGRLVLSVQAVDLACTVRSLRWNAAELLRPSASVEEHLNTAVF